MTNQDTEAITYKTDLTMVCYYICKQYLNTFLEYLTFMHIKYIAIYATNHNKTFICAMMLGLIAVFMQRYDFVAVAQENWSSIGWNGPF